MKDYYRHPLFRWVVKVLGMKKSRKYSEKDRSRNKDYPNNEKEN